MAHLDSPIPHSTNLDDLTSLRRMVGWISHLFDILFGYEDQLICLKLTVLNYWKPAIDVGRIATLHTPVIIRRKDKCVQNAISIFIGLLTTIRTASPKHSGMDLKRRHVLKVGWAAGHPQERNEEKKS
jgi:hypothetical protein